MEKAAKPGLLRQFTDLVGITEPEPKQQPATTQATQQPVEKDNPQWLRDYIEKYGAPDEFFQSREALTQQRIEDCQQTADISRRS